MPDRILLWIPRGANEGRCVFVECKAPGKTWTPNQARERDRHIDLGQEVYMVDTFDAVDELITHLRLKF